MAIQRVDAFRVAFDLEYAAGLDDSDWAAVLASPEWHILTAENADLMAPVGGASGSAGSGIKGARGPYPDGVNTRSRDYCRQDIVCKLGSTNTAEHMRYVTPGPDADNGAAFLAALI